MQVLQRSLTSSLRMFVSFALHIYPGRGVNQHNFSSQQEGGKATAVQRRNQETPCFLLCDRGLPSTAWGEKLGDILNFGCSLHGASKKGVVVQRRGLRPPVGRRGGMRKFSTTSTFRLSPSRKAQCSKNEERRARRKRKRSY